MKNKIIEDIRCMVNKKIPIRDIANKYNKKESCIRLICSRNKIKLTYNIKYKHLYKPVLKYYLNHSVEETCKKFRLTKKEFYSCYETAIKKYPWRKDQRRKDPWELDEYLFLLRCAGIIPLKHISVILNRGKNRTCSKEKLVLIGLPQSSRINGIPLRICKKLFGNISFENIKVYNNGSFGTYLVPWIEIYNKIKHKKYNNEIKLAIKSLSMFQIYIYETDNVFLEIINIIEWGAINGITKAKNTNCGKRRTA